MTKKIIPFMLIVGSFCFSWQVEGSTNSVAKCFKNLSEFGFCDVDFVTVTNTSIEGEFKSVNFGMTTVSITGTDSRGDTLIFNMLYKDKIVGLSTNDAIKECHKKAQLVQVDSEKLGFSLSLTDISKIGTQIPPEYDGPPLIKVDNRLAAEDILGVSVYSYRRTNGRFFQTAFKCTLVTKTAD